ncbi:MAG TPA: hypothetical protein VFZ09_45290 [Archangium sp.]|uniref:hypothetical protein n=1 Tax=Archangium sp. TaxID=1872627 RepID=UPI002E36523F|nr:hypothetical protein [Archangium sp.]HEX5753497.1 hypothetical protein [Archangium sp.]
MAHDWTSLIHDAVVGAVDDPYVRLLKERLRAGSEVVRIQLADSERGPEYVLILSLHRQLSEMRIPHSDAFTNWSLDAGARLADEEQEMRRFELLLHQRFAPLRDELDASTFDALLVQYVRTLGPSRASSLVQKLRTPQYAAQEGRAKQRAMQRIEDVLVELARALGRSLRYDEAATSRILDGALAQWMSRHLTTETQEESFPG